MDNKNNSPFKTEPGQAVYQKALRAINDFSMSPMIKSGVLVGLSGGADSVMLLYFLVEYRKQNGDFPIVAVHLNHSLRGEEADADEQLAKTLAEELGVEFISVRKDIRRIAKQSKKGIEEAARDARYSCFANIIQGRNDISSVAVAHNSTDNAETVIFNLLRGAGASGLSGIKPVRDNIIRPLIYSTSEEIRVALSLASIPYAVDSTNADEEYTRNYIRHTVLPSLKRLSSAPEEMLERACASIRDDDELLSSQATDVYTALARPISISELRNLTRPIFVRVIKLLFKDYSPLALERVHFESIYEKLNADNFSVSLPGGISFVCERGFCSFCTDFVSEEFDLELHMGENAFEEYSAKIIITDTPINNSSSNVYNFSIQLSVPFDIIDNGLYVRNKKDGDTILVGGHTKKLKRIFCDLNVPPSRRDKIPVLYNRDGILCVPGYRMRDGLNKAKPCAYLTILIDKSKEKRFYLADEWS